MSVAPSPPQTDVPVAGSLRLSSTDPDGSTQRRRTPAEVPSQVVVTRWSANPNDASPGRKDAPSSSASRANTAVEVSSAPSSQCASAAPAGSGSGAASRAGPARRAACTAPATASVSTASPSGPSASPVGAGTVATPAPVPPSRGTSTTTESRRSTVLPFVVIVEFAHRTTASETSRTRATAPASGTCAAAIARARSTRAEPVVLTIRSPC